MKNTGNKPKQNQNTERLLSTLQGVNKIKEFLGADGSLSFKDSLKEIMDAYFEAFHEDKALTRRQLQGSNIEAIKDTVDSIRDTISQLQTSQNPADRDRLENLTALSTDIISPRSNADIVNGRVDTENMYRSMTNQQQISPSTVNNVQSIVSAASSSQLLRLIGSSYRLTMNEVGNAWLGQMFGPLNMLVPAAFSGIKQFTSAAASDITTVIKSQSDILKKISDFLEGKLYNFENEDKEDDEEDDSSVLSLLDGMSSLLDWTGNYSKLLPMLFKFGGPVALAICAYLALKTDLDKSTDTVTQTLGDYNKLSKGEKEVIDEEVDQDVKSGAAAATMGMFGDSTVNSVVPDWMRTMFQWGTKIATGFNDDKYVHTWGLWGMPGFKNIAAAVGSLDGAALDDKNYGSFSANYQKNLDYLGTVIGADEAFSSLPAVDNYRAALYGNYHGDIKKVIRGNDSRPWINAVENFDYSKLHKSDAQTSLENGTFNVSPAQSEPTRQYSNSVGYGWNGVPKLDMSNVRLSNSKGANTQNTTVSNVNITYNGGNRKSTTQ